MGNLKGIETNLRRAREFKGISQESMAHELGISQNAYSMLENGRSKLTTERLDMILDILTMSLQDLLAFSDHVTFSKCNQAYCMNNTVHNYNVRLDEIEQRLKNLERFLKNENQD
jgi:transcriptional regulator with XRE-family HTH domain